MNNGEEKKADSIPKPSDLDTQILIKYVVDVGEAIKNLNVEDRIRVLRCLLALQGDWRRPR